MFLGVLQLRDAELSKSVLFFVRIRPITLFLYILGEDPKRDAVKISNQFFGINGVKPCPR